MPATTHADADVAAQWRFLEPWLDLLARNLRILPQFGWQHDQNGAAPLATRLEFLSIRVEKYAHMQSKGDVVEAQTHVRRLRRAMEIVALSLRVEPRVWTMLRGLMSLNVLSQNPDDAVKQHQLGRSDWCFRDEDVHVAFDLDTFYNGGYNVDAVMCCYRWLVLDDAESLHQEFECKDRTTSFTAFQDAMATIHSLNTFRVPLGEPIPVSCTLYLIGYPSAKLVEEIHALLQPRRNQRFQTTHVKFRAHIYSDVIAQTVSRIRAVHGATLGSFRAADEMVDDKDFASVVTNLGASCALASSASSLRSLSLWMNGETETARALQVCCRGRVDKLELSGDRLHPTTAAQLRQRSRASATTLEADLQVGVVERLECKPSERFGECGWNYLRDSVDPLCLALGLWGQRDTVCRMNMQSPRSGDLLMRLDDSTAASATVTPATEFVCIPGNDPRVAFVLMPPTQRPVRVEMEDLVVVSSEDGSAAFDNPDRGRGPLRWLANLRSLRLEPHTEAFWHGFRRLCWLVPSLVSLELVLKHAAVNNLLPAMLLSLPRSLQYLQLRNAASLPAMVDALLQAYSENGLRVKSLNLRHVQYDHVGKLLDALGDPTSAIATYVEELRVTIDGGSACIEPMAVALERMLAQNTKLAYLHIHTSVSQTQQVWRAAVARFHGTPMRNATGKRVPLASKLAFVSVVRRYELALDCWMMARVLAFADECLTRVVLVTRCH